jgi:hypothetical protein
MHVLLSTQRIEFAKDAPQIPHLTAQHDLRDLPNTANTNTNNNQQSQSRQGTAELRSRQNTADSKELGGLVGVEKEVLSKEEEEFLKLESIFITELGLHKDQLPAFARPPEPTTT